MGAYLPYNPRLSTIPFSLLCSDRRLPLLHCPRTFACCAEREVFLFPHTKLAGPEQRIGSSVDEAFKTFPPDFSSFCSFPAGAFFSLSLAEAHLDQAFPLLFEKERFFSYFHLPPAVRPHRRNGSGHPLSLLFDRHPEFFFLRPMEDCILSQAGSFSIVGTTTCRPFSRMTGFTGRTFVSACSSYIPEKPSTTWCVRAFPRPVP